MRADFRVIALAGGSVVLAIVLGFWVGAWIGVVSMLGGLIPQVLWQAATVRRDRRVATAERAAAVFRPEVSLVAAGSIADLLRPENEVVPFRPRPQSAQLLQWCSTAQQQRVRLVIGEGGAGKTRLAVQLERDLRAAKWQTRWVRRGEEADAVHIAGEFGRPALLVVDYAETRTGLLELIRAAADAAQQPPLRVLLLARSAGEWWEELLNSCDDRLSEALTVSPPLALAAVPASDREELFVDAVAAFAARLRLPKPDTPFADHDRDAVILDLHAAALLAVVEQQRGTDIAASFGDDTDVLARLLRHEARYWHQAARARSLFLDPGVERRAVALGAWIGASSETEAAELLRFVPDLAESPELRWKAARWQRDLYPVGSNGDAVGQPEWLGSLQPDRLAERLIGEVLADGPFLMQSVLPTLEPRRLLRALTIGARAARTDSRVTARLREALAAAPRALIPPLITVAIETDPAIGGLVAQTVEEELFDEETLLAFDSAIPNRTLALADAAVTIARQLVRLAPPGSSKYASRLTTLSNALLHAGHETAALTAITDAVAIFRRLAAERPREFAYRFANALMGLTGYLVRAGRPAEGLSSNEEAVTILRELADRDAAAYGPLLGDTLVNHGGALFFVGRAQDALPVLDEAIAIYRSLPAANFAARRGAAAAEAVSDAIAAACVMKSVCLGTLGRAEESRVASEEALATYRLLAEQNADAFRPMMAGVLQIHAAVLLGCGRSRNALSVIDEAVTAYQSLEANRPRAFAKDVAEVLAVRALCLEALGRTAAAREAVDDTVTVYRRALVADPTAETADIPGMLAEHAPILERCGRPAEAEAARRTAALLADRIAELRQGEERTRSAIERRSSTPDA